MKSSEKSLYQRIASIDLLRGIVMILMALDHTRDFFSNAFFNPLDLSRTTPPLFLTRWVTHFCAPVFILLAGVGAYHYQARGRSHTETARFLATRGLILIVLEFTLVHFGWFFSFEYRFLLAQVIWVIGWCMILLAGTIMLRTPLWLITLAGVLLIAGHNLLDGIRADQFASLKWLWIILHQPDTITFGDRRQLYALYSILPWVGVMAFGYSLAPLFLKESKERTQRLFWLGFGFTVAFILLRWTNTYGDPTSWIPYDDSILKMLSFINTTKYPPSLLFLLMTLGPVLMLLTLLERIPSDTILARFFSTFGRVPLFFYLLHLSLIHTLAVIVSFTRHGKADWLFGTDWLFRTRLPAEYGVDLPVVYVVWIGVLIILYPCCRWFARYKSRSQAGWLSYI